MTSDAFLELHNTLVRYHDLKSTQEVEPCEALGMFLWDNRRHAKLETGLKGL
jgi:hypothetical protein